MNSPEYTTSAPVIGPLIMCSGLRVSAKPYHPRHRVAPSSRVVVARQSIDRSLESRLVSSRSPSRVVSSRRLLAHHFPHHPSSSIHPSSSRVVSVASSRSRRSRLSRRSHREHESPIRHRSPKMRRLRSRRSVDEGTNRHDRSVLSVLAVPRRALPPRGRLSVSQSSITLCRACAVCPHCANGDARDGESVERTRDHEMERVWGRRDRCRSRMRRRRGTHGARDECDACMT